MSIKIAIIGAGSVGFTRTLLADVLSVPEFGGTVFGFHDIDARNLDMVTQLCRKGIEASGLAAVRADGSYRGTNTWAGAARIAEKGIEQLRAENASSVLAADKAAEPRAEEAS